MKLKLATALAFLAAPAFAQDVDLTATGDAEAGEAAFRQCQTCHVVVDDEGETLAGRSSKTGPNLYKVAGRTAGTVEGFRYSSGLTASGEKGLVWTEETFVPYLLDPTPYLREYLGEASARSNMTFKVRSEDDAKNLYAYLLELAEDDD
jgi:cytochrome c